MYIAFGLYFLAGKRLSRTRFTPQVAAPPITPPATARPTKAAPAMTIGAILASGAAPAPAYNTPSVFDDEKSIMALYE